MKLAALGSAAVLAIVPSVACAQPAPRSEVNISAQGLGSALTQVGRQTRTEIIFSPSVVEGKTAPAIRGNLSAEEALDQLLAGSGLKARRTATGAFVIEHTSSNAIDSLPSKREIASGERMSPIVVTGSRLRGGSPTSPVITISEESIRRAGHKNMADVLQSIPQNFGGGQNPSVASSGGNINNQDLTGASSINLRGIGPDGTLTLLNGRRLAYGSFNQSVDVSSIPLGAIDRIEIVADGASAIYGSDAVAGVANIILKRDFQGLSTSARLGFATEGGARYQNYNAVGGMTNRAGGFLIGYDFEESKALFASQRDFVDYIPKPRTILPYLRRHNLIITGHVNVTDALEIAADALYNKRDSWSASRISTSSGLSERETEGFIISPRATLRLANGWNIVAHGVLGSDDTDFRSRAFTVAPEPILIADSRGCYCNSTRGAEVTAEGALFRMPGGSARLAMGAGIRSNDLSFKSSFVSTAYESSLSSHYAYAEMSLPLVSPQNSNPIVSRLLLVGAARYESYTGNVGKVTTPKIGISYSPVKGVDVRASWGKSFKAPTLTQSSTPVTAYLYDAQVFGGTAGQVIMLSGGNKNLKPERATTWSGTFEIKPWRAGPRLSVSYFNIAYRDRVLQPIVVYSSALSNPQYVDFVEPQPSPATQESAIGLSDAGLQLAGPASYDPATVVAILDNRYLNVASQKIDGVDLSFASSFALAGGTAGVDASASYVRSTQRIYHGAPSLRLAGTAFNPPKYRARFSAYWQNENFVAAGYLNYLAGVRDVLSSPTRRGSAMVTEDISLSFTPNVEKGLLAHTETFLSIQNVTNEGPPFLANATPFIVNYDSTNYSALGRFVSFGIRKKW